ncbi:MAG: ABC transporter permease [Chloroflexi bacterium]|nr:ABC transporter permease [Chloroflexota bacterium]
MTASNVSQNPPLPETLATTIIEPTRGWASLGLRDLWEYRELLMLLVWREIKGAYRQTALGVSWLFLRPILNVLVLTLVFGMLVQVPSNDLPYALFSLSALLPWGYFSNAVLRSAGSLVQNMEIISKVYFPRMIIAVAGVLSGLVDLAASFIVFVVFMLIYRVPLRIEMLWLPGFILAAVLMALTVGLWLATLSVRYRDVSFAVNFLLQALMYLSPVIYPISSVPEKLVFFYQLNPMAGIIDGFRWALLGPTAGSPPGTTFWISMGILGVLLVVGAFIFRRTERTIVDVL